MLQAEIEGESQLVTMKYQNKMQRQQMLEQTAIQNEMMKDQMATQTSAQSQMMQDQMAMQSGQPPQPPQPELAPGPRRPELLEPPAEVQSPLTLRTVRKLPATTTGEDLIGQVNVDLMLLGRQIADHIANMPPAQRPAALSTVKQRSPQLYDVVLGLMGSAPSTRTQAAAARPLPEQKPPRRGPEASLI